MPWVDEKVKEASREERQSGEEKKEKTLEVAKEPR